MPRSIWLLAFGLAFSIPFGCGGTTSKAKSTPVKGTVTLDGKPLVDGEITFLLAGEAPSVIPIKDGAYTGNAFAGSNKVEILAFKEGPPLSTDPTKTPTKRNFIPDRFNVMSKLTAEVVAGGANDFKFDVTSR
jgi:hypothetical protein